METPSNAASTGVIERLEQYQWPLASVALALLLGALVWSRKRRERQWEDAPTPAGMGAADENKDKEKVKEMQTSKLKVRAL